MRYAPVVLVAVVALSVGRSAVSQQVPQGTRVRFNAPDVFDGARYARVVRMTNDSLHVVYTAGDSAVLPMSQVGYIDRSRGKHSPLWATLSPILLVPAGAVGGVTMALVPAIGDPAHGDGTLKWGAGIGAAMGLAAGIALATQKTEVWEPVRLPTLRWYQTATLSRMTVPSAHARQKLKLRVNGREVEGNLVEDRGDTIEISRNAIRTSIPIASISDARVSRGKSERAGAKVGALWGLGAGIAIAGVSIAGPNEENDLRDETCDPSFMICERESDLSIGLTTVVGSALIGAAIGAVIGREQWVRATLPTASPAPAKLLLVPGRDRVRIGLSATF